MADTPSSFEPIDVQAPPSFEPIDSQAPPSFEPLDSGSFHSVISAAIRPLVDGFSWAMTPIPALQAGKKALIDQARGSFGAAENRMLPAAVTQEAKAGPAGLAARAAVRSLIPLPSPDLAQGAIEATAPVAPLDIAGQVALPLVGAGMSKLGDIAATRVGAGLDAGLAKIESIPLETIKDIPKIENIPMPIISSFNPDQLAQWANNKQWYHGSGTPGLAPETMSTSMTKIEGLFGHGVYLTDNPSVAESYAKIRAGSSGNPNVYGVTINASKILNMDQPVISEIVSAMKDAMPSEIAADISNAANKADATMRDVWKAMSYSLMDYSKSNEIPASEFVDNFQLLTSKLSEMGYDALRYQGGIEKKSIQHEVLVLLDPQRELTAFTKEGVPGNLVNRPNPISSIKIEDLPKIITEKGPMPNPGPALAQAVEATTTVTEQAKAALMADPAKVVAFQTNAKNTTESIIKMVEDGSIAPAEGARLFGIEAKPDEVASELVKRFREASTSFGQGLNRLSQVQRLANDLFKGRPELQAIIDQAALEASQSQNIAQRLINPMVGATSRVIQTWRGLLVTQIGTSVRNALVQGGRVGAGMFDDAVNGSLRALTGKEATSAAFSNVTEDFMSIVRQLQPAERAKLSTIIDQFPKAKAELGSRPLSDVIIGNKFVAMLNTLNTAQEGFFRKIAFDARLKSNLTRLGLTADDLQGMIRAGGDSLKKASALIDDSVQHALNMTFAENPEFGKGILKFYRDVPIMSVLANPFPRFWLNAMKFTTEFSPLGVLYSLPGAKNPEMAMRGLSRAITGTTLYGAAYAIRNSPYAGEKWYEIRPDPDKNPLRVVDMRNFNPFATNLFLADFVRRMVDVKHNKRPDLGYSSQDIANAVFAMRRSDFAGIPILDGFVFNKSDLTEAGGKWIAPLKNIVGNFLGGFATPIKNVRDLSSVLVNDGKVVGKDTSLSPLLGPTAEAIPGARDVLPDQPSMTRAGPVVREEMGKRQLAGLSIKTKTPVEQELDNLNLGYSDLAPRLRDDEANLVAKQQLGKLVERYGMALLSSPEYHKLSYEEKKIFFKEAITEAKKNAVSAVKDMRPDIAARLESMNQKRQSERDKMQSISDKYRPKNIKNNLP